jgi:NADH dehydrogenase
MKNLAHAIALRDRAIQMLELASATSDADSRKEMLHFVVVGANFTGVEVAGEFQDYLCKAARSSPGLDPSEVRVTLVDRNEKVLSVLDEPTLSDWAANHMQRRGIELRLKESVNEIRPTWVVLRGGQVLRTRTVIWCAGIAPNPVLQAMRHDGEPLPNDHGWILCERDGRVKGQAAVWGVGDCAVNPDPAGKGYPATAQSAIGEARGVADNVARVLRGEATQPVEVKDRGSLAAFGRFDAVAKVMGFKFTGFIAWFLWRTVYLMKMPGIGRKIRVAADWTLELVTRRDYVELGLGRPPAARRDAKEPVPGAAT